MPKNPKAINVCAVFDNEEVGSNTKQGAMSTFMKDDITPKEALFIRQWVSSIVYFFFIVFEGHALFNFYSVLSRPTRLDSRR